MSDTPTQPSRLFARAGRALRSAENLLTAGYSEDATSIASFAWFYTAWGLLLASGFGPFRHDQVRSLFRRHFAEPGLLDPSYSTRMEQAYQLRLLADFEPAASIEPQEVTEMIAGGREFLAAVSRYLAEHSERPAATGEPFLPLE
jgi:uncharacterized protein (UPF0332 family)